MSFYCYEIFPIVHIITLIVLNGSETFGEMKRFSVVYLKISDDMILLYKKSVVLFDGVQLILCNVKPFLFINRVENVYSVYLYRFNPLNKGFL